MPIGTIDIAAVNETISPLTPIQIPMLAGTIVVGRVIIPPIAPPLRSMKTVAKIATMPAINDDNTMLLIPISMRSAHSSSNRWISSAFLPEVGILRSERIAFNS